jgi:hypothetical protein
MITINAKGDATRGKNKIIMNFFTSSTHTFFPDESIMVFSENLIDSSANRSKMSHHHQLEPDDVQSVKSRVMLFSKFGINIAKGQALLHKNLIIKSFR